MTRDYRLDELEEDLHLALRGLKATIVHGGSSWELRAQHVFVVVAWEAFLRRLSELCADSSAEDRF